MVLTSQKGKNKVWQLWLAIAAIVIAAFATFLLTRPAAAVMSMTPLSGLMTLKSMATEAMPFEAALTNQKPTLIEFYADWCTTCQSMSGTVASLHEQYGTDINFVMLDIDDPQWADEVASFGASGVPQFTLLDADHESVKTWVGKVPKPIFRRFFDQMLS
ncbi:MAG: thioredoxin domain-containing protein [Cyanobacteria bacterium J06554_11]